MEEMKPPNSAGEVPADTLGVSEWTLSHARSDLGHGLLLGLTFWAARLCPS